MEPTPLSDFYPHLYAEVNGVPELLARNALRLTCIEFCQQTLLMRERLPDIPMSANVAEYELEPSICDSEVCRVLSVWVDGALTSAVTPAIGQRMDVSFESTTPRAYYLLTPHLITVTPTPTATATLSVEVAIQPDTTGDNVPKDLYDRYQGIIVRGAAARLMLMPAREWTNVKHGELYRRMYWTEMHNSARQDHWDGFAQPMQVPAGRFL